MIFDKKQWTQYKGSYINPIVKDLENLGLEVKVVGNKIYYKK